MVNILIRMVPYIVIVIKKIEFYKYNNTIIIYIYIYHYNSEK